MIYGKYREGHRVRLIDGLRALATYLEDRPELPVPHGANVAVSVLHGTDEEKKAEVERIACLIGSAPDPTAAGQGHHKVKVTFGPVEYSVTAITEAATARWDAVWSYRDAVSPDPPSGA
ncbi:hypothetical protein [Nonomuraea diastatica]|uniref:Uncharacterized protein n=1 Tax=Nonomuraea diastatica TaxID=1848329 RepID=A0A4V2YF93_9ACTN|nr:hypothetical protein [Nonomuraea diastatica]TDD22257.1 hypothetical protein E1294_12435 [Nonomuraea diastatica]